MCVHCGAGAVLATQRETSQSDGTVSVLEKSFGNVSAKQGCKRVRLADFHGGETKGKQPSGASINVSSRANRGRKGRSEPKGQSDLKQLFGKQKHQKHQ